MINRLPPLMYVFLTLSACQGGMQSELLSDEISSRPQVPGHIEVNREGKCFTTDTPDFDIEIVNAIVLSRPEEKDSAGNVVSEGIYKHVSRPQKISKGVGSRFEVLCPQEHSVSFIQALQRAFLVRGYAVGDVTGTLNFKTRAAIQLYQKAQGLNSSMLSLKTAQDFGLKSIE